MGETVKTMNTNTFKPSNYMYTIQYDENNSCFKSTLKKDITIKPTGISTPFFHCIMTNPFEEYCEFSIAKKVGPVVLEYITQTVEALYIAGNRDVVVTFDAYSLKIANMNPSVACIISSVCYDMILNNKEDISDFVKEVLNQ